MFFCLNQYFFFVISITNNYDSVVQVQSASKIVPMIVIDSVLNVTFNSNLLEQGVVFVFPECIKL